MICCKFCGKLVPDDAEICKHCGRRIKEAPRQYYSNPEHEYSKTGIGVVMALFLGLIGLIIGCCMYPSGTTARSTFVKGWVTTFVVTIVIGIIVGVIYYVVVMNMIGSYY